MVRDKLYISKEYHIQPSEINAMPFYEYEQIKQEIHLIQKEEEKRQKEQEKTYGNMNPSSMMNSMKSSMNNNFKTISPNMSKMPNMNMPKL